MVNRKSDNKNGNILPKSGNAITKTLIINTIMNHSNDFIYFKDMSSRFLIVSKMLANGLGIDDPSDAVGKTDFDFFSESYARSAFEDEQKILNSSLPVIGKMEKGTWPNGKAAWVSTYKYPLLDNGGTIIGTWGISRDITELKLAEEELEKLNLQLKEANRQLEVLSAKDALSDLYNHRYFYEQTQKEFDICTRQKKKSANVNFAIIVFDIDYFKKINDSYGHLIGDFAIRHVADLLKRTVRRTDTAFRYGGDEFVVLLPNTNKDEARKVSEKIRQAIAATPAMCNENKVSVPITVSGGVSSFDEAVNINDLIEKADQRLYQSKANGRNMFTS